jgi:hypothetical protein
MNHKLSKTFKGLCLLVAVTFTLSSCYETHYYHRYHHHTREWYDNHHVPPPAGVDFNIDVR